MWLFVLVLAAVQPRIDSISPAQGPIAGGTVVTISGSGFAGAAVTLDRAPVVPLSQTDSVITLTMPRHGNGFALIGISGEITEFLYVPPRLDEIPPGAITTISGIGQYERLFGSALNATLLPEGLAYDANGNLYITQEEPGYLIRLHPDGTIERFAGTGSRLSPTGDGGAALDASIWFPRSVGLDAAGNVYVTDVSNRIRRIDATTGIITTIAGTGKRAFSGDGGPATAADIGQPTFLAVDADSVYFIDFNAMRVRRIRNGIITTFAGNGTPGFSGDGGPATDASFDTGVDDFGGLALDSAGNLYIADSKNRRIRRVDRASGVITTFFDASDSKAQWYADHFEGIAVDHNDHLFYCGTARFVEIDHDGKFVKTWNAQQVGSTVIDGPWASAYTGGSRGIAFDAANDLAFSDEVLSRVRRIDRVTNRVETLAGTGPAILGENGPAIATLSSAQDLAFNAAGELIVAEGCCGPRLRKLDSRGNLLTLAGGGLTINDSQPVPALSAQLDTVNGVVPGANGNIDFMSWAACLLRRYDAQNVRVLYGKRTRCGYTGDGGPASAATFCQPWDFTPDAAGNIFMADTNNNRIRRIDAQSGIVTTFAGNGGPTSGFERYQNGTFCGDGGPALDACLNTPYGVVFDPAGNLYVSEFNRIRKIDPSGMISTFVSGFFATKLRFDRGYLYAARVNGTLDRYDAAGHRTIVAGIDGKPGFSGDGGPANAAKIGITGQASGIAIDRDGNIYFCDTRRVRAVRSGVFIAPANATIAASASGSAMTATVRDGAGIPSANVRVDFAVPTSGASCTLSVPFAITDANGVATTTCTPNCVAGSYSVTATPLSGVANATVTMTNSGHCHTRAARH